MRNPEINQLLTSLGVPKCAASWRIVRDWLYSTDSKNKRREHWRDIARKSEAELQQRCGVIARLQAENYQLLQEKLGDPFDPPGKRDKIAVPAGYEGVSKGSTLYQIYSSKNLIYVNSTVVEYISLGAHRIICGFNVRTGVNPLSLGQFNQTFRDSNERGNHLHQYRMFTTDEKLLSDITRFADLYYRRIRSVTKR